MTENITCPVCRYRHPAWRSCADAKQLAKRAAERRRRADALREKLPAASMTKRSLLQWLQPFMDETEMRVQLPDGSTVPFDLTYVRAIGNEDARVDIVPLEPL